MTVPFLDLQGMHQEIRPALDAAWQRVMASGRFLLGEELASFESEFATYCEAPHCVGVGNGLDAIRLLLLAHGIGPGDEVIVPANTFIATLLAVSECGATPVPVEPLAETSNIDPAAVAAAITPRTAAIMAVHLYGQPAEMDALGDLASRHGLLLLEDAAQSHGARYRGRRAGNLAQGAAVSFYPGKNLGALGDGGAVLTPDRAIADKVRQLRNYGSSVKYRHELPGCNSRLDELQAAFLRAKLPLLDDWNARRTRLAARYTAALASSALQLPRPAAHLDSSWHLYVIRSNARDPLQAHLQEQGIESVIHYPVPPHLQACYRGQLPARFPLTEQLAREVLSLPMYPTLAQADQDRVIRAIGAFGGR